MTDTLLLISGGIDSTYCMWKHLQSGKSLRVHHVHLKNHEGRMKYETKAMERVLNWMCGHGLTSFTYTESSFDYGTIPFIVKDFHIWSFISGVIMADPKNRGIKKLIIPRHWDAFPGGPDSAGAKRSTRTYSNMVKLISGREPELVYPIINKMKADLIKEMPRDLLDCCWWCRRPKDGKACHKCYTCQLVDSAVKG